MADCSSLYGTYALDPQVGDPPYQWILTGPIDIGGNLYSVRVQYTFVGSPAWYAQVTPLDDGLPCVLVNGLPASEDAGDPPNYGGAVTGTGDCCICPDCDDPTTVTVSITPPSSPLILTISAGGDPPPEGGGCTGPFMYGVGGDCPCWGCKCCKPACCNSITANFDIDSCTIVLDENGDPVEQEGGGNVLAEDQTPTPPTPAVVTLTPAASGGICCIEYLDEGATLRAVGSGSVDATIEPASTVECGDLTVLVNGTPVPVTVADGDILVITVEAEFDDCCTATFVDAESCGSAIRMASIRGGNRIILNRKIVVQKIFAERMKRMKQRRLK